MSNTKTCGINYFCVGAVLIFGGSISLIPLGFTFILPYASSNHWQETMCTVINSSYTRNHCTCGEDPSINEKCVDKYPCLQVYGEYCINVVDAVNKHWNYKAVKPNETVIKERDASMFSIFKDNNTYSSREAQRDSIKTNLMRIKKEVIVQEPNILAPSPHRNYKHGYTNDMSNRTSQVFSDYNDKHGVKSKVSLLFRSWADSFFKTVSITKTLLLASSFVNESF